MTVQTGWTWQAVLAISPKTHAPSPADNATAPKIVKVNPEYLWVHNERVREDGYDCSWCLTFSRPERNLQVSPIMAGLEDKITILSVLVGFPAAPAQRVQDVNGGSSMGLDDAVNILRDISDY